MLIGAGHRLLSAFWLILDGSVLPRDRIVQLYGYNIRECGIEWYASRMVKPHRFSILYTSSSFSPVLQLYIHALLCALS